MTKSDVLIGLCHDLTYAISEYVEAAAGGRAPRLKERSAIATALVAIFEHIEGKEPAPPLVCGDTVLSERGPLTCSLLPGHFGYHSIPGGFSRWPYGTPKEPAPLCAAWPNARAADRCNCGKVLTMHVSRGDIGYGGECGACPRFTPENAEPGRSPPEPEPSKAMETAAAIVKTFG